MTRAEIESARKDLVGAYRDMWDLWRHCAGTRYRQHLRLRNVFHLHGVNRRHAISYGLPTPYGEQDRTPWCGTFAAAWDLFRADVMTGRGGGLVTIEELDPAE